MLKTSILVLVASLLGGAGHVMLSVGMKTMGDVTGSVAGGLVAVVWAIVSNRWVFLGVVFQAAFFFMYLALLSRAELTLVLPMTSISYIAVALLAQAFLAEAITPARWAGIVLIVVGVSLVSQS